MQQYIYDGSFDGLLTAIFYAYKADACITSQIHYQPNLLLEPIVIPLEDDKAARVATSIQTKLSHAIFQTIYHLYLSTSPSCEQLILDYLRLCYRYGPSINLAKNHDTIIAVDTLVRKVTLESHRLTGLIRFKEIAPMCFYARITPDHHILPLIAKHFVKRFSDQAFIIHDTVRQVALVYNKEEGCLQVLSPEENDLLLSYTPTDGFEELFKIFYNSTTIKARHNPSLQKRYMPTRYWKNLVEL